MFLLCGCGGLQGRRDVLDLFTLAFDSSPIKGEGVWLVVLDLFTLTPALWILP